MTTTRIPVTNQPFHIGDEVEHFILYMDVPNHSGTITAVDLVTETFTPFFRDGPNGTKVQNTERIAQVSQRIEYIITDKYGRAHKAEFTPGSTHEQRGYEVRIAAAESRGERSTFACLECGLEITAYQTANGECPHCGGF